MLKFLLIPEILLKATFLVWDWRKLVLILNLLVSGVVVNALGQNFSSNPLGGNIALNNPTSLDFGPDGRLYVSEQYGTIYALTVERVDTGNYQIKASEIIDLVKNIPNHYDDGTIFNGETKREVTGLYATGTASNPVLYVTSSDYRIGGSSSGADKNLDTNSGIISKLTWTGSAWDKVDLIRGLPRSEENHATNGLQIDTVNHVLYVAQGGNTNAGAPSNNFAYINEYALSAAVITVDLAAIESMPVQGSGDHKYIYDIPTVDDPTRSNVNSITDPSDPNYDGIDVNDPFGGNDGLNQARIVENGPVQIYSPGYRNIYDLVLADDGRLYTWDNGANKGWGGHPDKEGTYLDSEGNLATDVTNNWVDGEPGSSSDGPNDGVVNNQDGLHYIGNIYNDLPGSYYGGHPTPTRANPDGAGLFTNSGDSGTDGVFRSQITSDPATSLPADWPPLPLSMANPIEGDFQNAGVSDQSLFTLESSTNGIALYTASNFNGGLANHLLAASFDGNIYSVTLNSEGTINGSGDVNILASGFGSTPLDLITQSDKDTFPGTIWTVTYGDDNIIVFEPQDFSECTGADDPLLDEDGDGYSNADEIDNGTDPCNGASMPKDHDGDLISDLNDTDDDNDGLPDTSDRFVLDDQNGLKTDLPVNYTLLNGDPGFGFYGLGFTGIMTDTVTDYLELIKDETNSSAEIIAGGAVGLFTINGVTDGDALESLNNQHNGFQFGLNVNAAVGPFTIESKISGPVFSSTPEDFQSMGIYLGSGDQDNYVKVVINANGGKGGLKVVQESGGVVTSQQFADDSVGFEENVNLYLGVDPFNGTVQPMYSIGTGAIDSLGTPIVLDGSLLQVLQETGIAPAVGIIATSRGTASDFSATWDEINVSLDPKTSKGFWKQVIADTGEPNARHENAYVQIGDKFYLAGGRKIMPVDIYDPATNTWTAGAQPPVELHHFQGLEYEGLLYVLGAFTGNYPDESPVQNIYIYDPVADSWTKGPGIPRPRGSGGAIVYNDKIYWVSGLTNGHTSGHVKWFDVYDPKTNTWDTLAPAPRARDHFHAVVADDKLFLAGGRQSKYPETFKYTTPEVDVYDFSTGTWSTLLNNIPTQRAGAPTALLGEEVVVIGGESNASSDAHQEVEALHIHDHTWRSLSPMLEEEGGDVKGKHGTQAIVNNEGIYVAAGSGKKGGYNTKTQQAFYFYTETNPTGTAITKGQLDAPSEVSFGSVQVGDTVTKQITITNIDGNQGFLINNFTLGDTVRYSLAYPYELPVNLGPEESFNIDVAFAPDDTVDQSSYLAIEHTGSNNPVKISLGSSGSADPYYVVNSGGGEILFDGEMWDPDNYYTGGSTYSNYEIDNGLHEIYKTERSSPDPFGYAFPNLAPGYYLVDLHFAEIYFGATGGSGGGVGKRVFNVGVENGQGNLENFDIYAEVGAMAPLVKSFIVEVTDSVLNVDFTVVENQPKISAIGIFPSNGPQEDTTINLEVDPVTHHFDSVLIGVSSEKIFTLLNNEDSVSITVDSTQFTKGSNTVFGHNLTSGTAIPAASTYDFSISFTPESSVGYYDTLLVYHSGDNTPLAIALSGHGKASSSDGVAHFINGGGPNYYGDTVVWMADKFYLDGKTYENNDITDITGTTRDSLYISERYGGSGTLSYAVTNIPSGEYEVELHFAEIYFGATGGSGGGDGKRVFDVDVENGQGFLNDFDIYAEVGAMAALVKNFSVEVTDGTLNIDFVASVNNPKISAFMVKTIPQDTLVTVSSSPSGYDFGKVEVGKTSPEYVFTITNEEFDSYITLDSMVYRYGLDKIFTNTFSPDTTIAPQETYDFSVAFAPDSNLVYVDTLEIYHNGDNSPELIAVKGEGTTINLVDLEVNPSNHTFSDQVVATTSDPASFTLSTPDDATIFIDSVIMTGNHPQDFSSKLAAGDSLTMTDSLNFDVVFTPQDTSDRSATMEIYHSGDNGKVAVFLDGKGLPRPDLAVTPESYHFQSQQTGTTSDPAGFTLSTLDSGATITVDSVKMTGNNPDEFSTDLNAGARINVDSSHNFNVTFTPVEATTRFATLEIYHDGGNSTLLVGLSGEGINESPVLYRINAGGDKVAYIDTEPIDWDSDNSTNPSPYRINGKAYSTKDAITLGANVPSSTPAEIFKAERWEKSSEGPMSWHIPVDSGKTVELRLYFAEIYFTNSGKRVFDVLVDGITVINNLDVYDSVGHDVGFMQSVNVVSDESIDITFKGEIQNPNIKGIEIIEVNQESARYASAGKDSSYGNKNADGVRLKTFQGKYAGFHGVNLQWVTTNDFGNTPFDLERSLDTKNWEKVGSVSSTGTSNHEQKYVYSDNLRKELKNLQVYYRLHYVNINSNKQYSNALAVWIPGSSFDKAAFKVHAYDSRDRLKVFAQMPDAGDVKLRITDVSGKMLFTNKYKLPQGYAYFHIEHPFRSGVYLMEFSGQQLRERVRFLVE